jgi:hypothetical protein
MFNEGNQIHNFMSSSGSGTVINYGSGSGSDFFTSYGSGSGSTSQKVTVPTVPVPVPQHCYYMPDIIFKTNFSLFFHYIRLYLYTMLRIRDVHPGSEFFHPGSRIQGQKDSGSPFQIHFKEFKYF